MRVKLHALATILAASAVSAAVVADALDKRALPSKFCYTILTSKNPPKTVRTTSVTISVPKITTVTKTQQSTRTITPVPVTQTAASTVTNTQSVTVTAAEATTTISQTQTVTVTTLYTADPVTQTETQTVSKQQDATTTVSAVSGYLPIQSTLPNSMYKRSREAFEARIHARELLRSRANRKSTASKSNPYPQKVVCVAITTSTVSKTITTTKSASTITAPTATSTISTTTTTVSTTTLYPDPITNTIYSTITNTATVTSSVTPAPITVTKTTTILVTSTPQSTVYAQCADSTDYASQGNGGHLFSLELQGDIIDTPATDAVNCCSMCQLLGTCSVGIYDDVSGKCYLMTGDQCSFASQNQYAIATGPSLFGYHYFNGNCGQISRYY